MGQSYRIRTELGINKTINVELNQDYEFLEILSLKIQQADVYTRSCSEYGVIVGRVTANNGFGVPNAKLSVFIPISDIDFQNELIRSIYPYRTIGDKNEDGYRYNLLPYEKSYSKHAATGTFPSRNDALTNSTVIEIVDKYYKFTVKTNESGDYMIMGVPTGFQTLVMDLDLSDMGEFSLTPQDLIRMGLATESQVSGNSFRTSEDLSSLPQIINITKIVEVSPLWGEPEICQIAINRVDFDLRDEANVDIQPTAVFMGSIFSTPDKFRIRKNCKPRDNMGNLCDLTTSPGQILAIRQTIFQDTQGNPILEQFQLEQSGNIIDGNGTWLAELPMNLDYYITNEFGEKVFSNDPKIGIPTKAKYRFKIKWQQPNDLTIQTRRGYFLVPNVKEYGWSNDVDPNDQTIVPPNSPQGKKLKSSYYFGLDFSGYTDGFSGQEKTDRENDIISCNDTFYEFIFNKVYTVSSLIDQWKKGFNRGRFIGVKEIDDDSCASTNNKFPVNDGVRNFDFLYFIFALIFQIIQIIGLPLVIAYHFITFLWNNFAVPLLFLLILYFGYLAGNEFALAAATSAGAAISWGMAAQIAGFILKGILFTGLAILLSINFRKITKWKFGRIKLPMITYPDCQACDCEPEETSEGGGVIPSSLMTQFSNPGLYYEGLESKLKSLNFTEDDTQILANTFTQSIAGRADTKDINIYKTTVSLKTKLIEPPPFKTQADTASVSRSLPMGERINVFNARKKYFDGVNRISVTFDEPSNVGKKHFDNTLTVVTSAKFEAGTMFSFIDPLRTTDVNYLYSAETRSKIITGISGTSKNINGGSITVNYANPMNQTSGLVQQYNLYTGTTLDNYEFPSDLEYYQVVTALTISDFFKISNLNDQNYLPGILNSDSVIDWYIRTFNIPLPFTANISTKDVFLDFSSQYVTIMQRGVDPYSPQYVNKYGLGKLFGLPSEDSLVITASTKLNIPIQPISSGLAVQEHSNQNNIFYDSYFWLPGQDYSGFTTPNVGYYSGFDFTKLNSYSSPAQWNGLNGIITSTSNNSWSELQSISAQSYQLSEDLSGVGYLYTQISRLNPAGSFERYFAPSLLPTYTASPLNIISKTKNVLRTDRLPNSDFMDGSGWNKNAAALQQNLGFSFFVIGTGGPKVEIVSFSTGAQQVTADIEGQIYESEVISSLNTCANMVSLSSYSGFGSSFGVNTIKEKTDSVENGCYVLVKRPLLDLAKDLNAWSEWGYRFRFFYGLCRGVLSQIFVNNWVNGTLFAFPIQVDVFFDKNNKPSKTRFCNAIIYFDTSTNNFYYRSSPYDTSTKKFVGKPTQGIDGAINARNLLFPTTIMNLGVKDYVFSEISLEPSNKGYTVNYLDSTSYGDTSDLVNLFVISRITDEGFLKRLIPSGNNSLNQLFSRDERRIDGDLAQLLSINSEIGNIKFSPEYYAVLPGQTNNPVNVLGTANNPTLAVWFSSTTEDLQIKDYLTPGRINFRGPNNIGYYPYPYGIKSQIVPFYKWKLTTTTPIFGTEKNTWATNGVDIIQNTTYQGLDRVPLGTKYFQNQSSTISDLNARGYIFSIDPSGNYSTVGAIGSSFVVGAPFHFYFGVVKGETALNKFKTKYSLDE